MNNIEETSLSPNRLPSITDSSSLFLPLIICEVTKVKPKSAMIAKKDKKVITVVYSPKPFCPNSLVIKAKANKFRAVELILPAT